MGRERDTLSELRTDPVTGRIVYISEDRAGRPTDYAGFEKSLELHVTAESAADCPFCEGHERQTPPTAAEVRSEGHWRVRVIPNKYPVVNQYVEDTGDSGRLGSGATLQPFGAHEVIIESPIHLRDVTDLSTAEYVAVMRVYRDRIAHWMGDERIRQVILFKNVGFAAGASLEHLHSQLVATPRAWPAVQAELDGASNYYQEHRRCIYCDLVAGEQQEGTRVVAEDDHFLAFCAFAGRQPFETWIVPKQHQTHFHLLEDVQLKSLAAIQESLIRRLQSCLSPLSYNLILHTAPAGSEHAESYHWHWELMPRSTRLAGFEFGSGAHINPLSPERAAKKLQSVKL